MRKREFTVKLLLVVSGLPGTGKSRLAESLSKKMLIPIFSVDPIEAAIWRSGIEASHETGVAAYEVAATLAEEHLKLGHSAIIDAVNPIAWARQQWSRIAQAQQATLVVIECVCSDINLHRSRIEKRVRNISGMPEISWDRVEQRRKEYEPWQRERFTADSILPIERLVESALKYIDQALGK